jgi:undecaprenyl-diphosphatase
MQLITYFQAIVIGLIQGVTELFPISSLGHSVILPSIFHWNIDQNADYFLSFLVLVHVATALVLLGFFWRDWVRIVRGFFTSLIRRRTQTVDERLAWLVIIATLPAGLIGLLLQKKLQALFASPFAAAAFLILLLFIAEAMQRRKKSKASELQHQSVTEDIRQNNQNDQSSKGREHMEADAEISTMNSFGALKIGLLQCLALIPGFSRTGAAMTGSMGQGLSREAALRFSFLLSTPIILAAAVLKVPELYHQKEIWGEALAGAIAAAVAAFVSVKFLTKYFETKSLRPFSLYCIGAGIIFLVLLSFGI